MDRIIDQQYRTRVFAYLFKCDVIRIGNQDHTQRVPAVGFPHRMNRELLACRCELSVVLHPLFVGGGVPTITTFIRRGELCCRKVLRESFAWIDDAYQYEAKSEGR